MMKADVTALSGDPMASMSEIEWSLDMMGQFGRLSDRRAKAMWREMSDDEQDIMRELVADGTRELLARLDWIAASAVEPVAA